MKVYYTYMWLRENGTPYYVGKGQDDRAFHQFERQFPPPDRSRILIQEFPSEEDAFFAEIFLITYYGRKDIRTGILRNLTDGGENPPKRYGRQTEEQRRAISDALIGRIGGMTGKKHSTETRRKMSQIKIGKASRPKGFHLTEDHKKKIGEANLGSKGPWSRKRRAVFEAKKASGEYEETRQKQSTAAKRRAQTAVGKNHLIEAGKKGNLVWSEILSRRRNNHEDVVRDTHGS